MSAYVHAGKMPTSNHARIATRSRPRHCLLHLLPPAPNSTKVRYRSYFLNHPRHQPDWFNGNIEPAD